MKAVVHVALDLGKDVTVTKKAVNESVARRLANIAVVSNDDMATATDPPRVQKVSVRSVDID